MRLEDKLRLADALMNWTVAFACLWCVWYGLRDNFPQLTPKQGYLILYIVILCYVRPGFPEATRHA